MKFLASQEIFHIYTILPPQNRYWIHVYYPN